MTFDVKGGKSLTLWVASLQLYEGLVLLWQDKGSYLNAKFCKSFELQLYIAGNL